MFKKYLVFLMVIGSISSAMDQKALKEAVHNKQAVEKNTKAQADEANSNLRGRHVHLAKAGAYTAGAYTAGKAAVAGVRIGLLGAVCVGCYWLDGTAKHLKNSDLTLAVGGSCCCAACCVGCGYYATAWCCNRAIEHAAKAHEIKDKMNKVAMER